MSQHLLNALRDEARSNLVVLPVQIVGMQGSAIDVGETFIARFRVRNTFAGSEGEQPGHAHFTDVKLHVSKTAYATPVDGDAVEHDVIDHLGYGHTASVDVRMRATAKLPFDEICVPSFPNKPPTDCFPVWETIANVRVVASFDITRFFVVVQDQVARAQIE